MPYFICHSPRYLLATNLKAMFSTLTEQSRLQRLSRPGQLWCALLQSGRLRDFGPQYLIVRDPYRRLVSFFNDKFRQHPLGVDSSKPYGEWQSCQKLLFPYMGVTRSTPPEQIRRALSEFSFERFVRCLPGIYMRDGHLRPQNRIRFVAVKGVPLGVFRVHRVLRMESTADMQFLSMELGVDTTRCHNATTTRSTDNLYTPELLTIVNRLYADDFSDYAYEMYDQPRIGTITTGSQSGVG